jgi:NADH dehydrogenase/NADH:ubiquinone oxidoreductase subunit G
MTEESKIFSFTINGKLVCAKPGETVMNIAVKNGITIPGLCHHESVSSYGACRLCVVEVFWGKKSKIVASCVYFPSPDDVVETNNKRVRFARRMIIELLLARCPGVEVIQNLAREYDVEQVRFAKTSGSKNEQRCILCGLCVRVCDEVIGRHAISYANRGADRMVTTPFDDQSDDCIGCGACVFVCPTKALHYEDIEGKRILAELHTQVPLVKCRLCGNAFASQKQIDVMIERLKIAREMAETCPKCRSSSFGETMAQVLGRYKAGEAVPGSDNKTGGN